MYKGKSNRSNVQIVPLDALLKEKENATSAKPTAIRSAGKLGKWGVTSFTSIRTAYSLGLQHQKDFKPPVSEQLSKSEEESDSVEAPKPRKFFKSRASIQTQSQTQQLPHSTNNQQQTAVVQHSDSTDTVVDTSTTAAAAKQHNKGEKKSKKLKPEIKPERAPERTSARNRNKCVNYNEDDAGSLSSVAKLTQDTTNGSLSKQESAPKQSIGENSSLSTVELNQQLPEQQPIEHPKIVLRISKGTARFVDTSTSEEETPLIEKIPISYPKKKLDVAKKHKKRKHSKMDTESMDQPPPDQVEELPVVDELEQKLAEIVHEPVDEQIDQLDVPKKRSLRTRITNAKKGEILPVEPVSAVEPTPIPIVVPNKMTNKRKTVTTPKKVSSTTKKSPEKPELATAVRATRATRKRRGASPDIETDDANVVPKSPERNVTPSVPEKKRHIDEKAVTISPSSKSRNKASVTCVSAEASLPKETTSTGPVQDEVAPPSVKLVISKKKGSIFKSRALVNETGNKRHVYKHKWEDDDKEKAADKSPEPATKKPLVTGNHSSVLDEFDDFDGPSTTEHNKISVTKSLAEEFGDDKDTQEPLKERKGSYMFVRNVKKAHQMQEIGEFQELDDDVEYILSALQKDNPMSTRCLSALQLASKCITPAFRMHVRAHGIVTKFFRSLRDAPSDPNLGLCTATVLFVLSQDTLHMDLDRDSLELMLNLLDVSKEKKCTGASLKQLQKNKEKVRELCEEIKSHGKAPHLNLDNITIGTLAVETLLSLTSKRAGEWFKEELRNLGGIDHIMKTVCDCCRAISDYVAKWTEDLLDKLRKIERCLRVLENVTQQNEENQKYIIKYNDGDAIDILVKFYKLCDTEISLYPTNETSAKDHPGCVIREALTPTLKVLINLTHPFNHKAEGSVCVGQLPGIFDTSLHLLLQSTNYVPENCVFEISFLVLLLLINLTTHSELNRALIMQAHAPTDFGSQFAKTPAMKALVEYFYKEEELATLAGKNTDAILDTPKEAAEKLKKSQEEMEETVTKLLQKAGNNMEHTMLASYVCILIGHLIMENNDYKNQIRHYLHDKSFSSLANILDKYYNFMKLTGSSESSVVEHIKSTKKILDYLKETD
ncbi:protein wings apart-like [Culicoides brevitarsis]|uniref:protein wings apart-like n=1 Tax=Culicoides brevitarsis TaxID=469753 RepID=UPI00307B520F